MLDDVAGDAIALELRALASISQRFLHLRYHHRRSRQHHAPQSGTARFRRNSRRISFGCPLDPARVHEYRFASNCPGAGRICPVFRGGVKSYDFEAIADRPGVHSVVEFPMPAEADRLLAEILVKPLRTDRRLELGFVEFGWMASPALPMPAGRLDPQALQNFPITGIPISQHPKLVNALAAIKGGVAGSSTGNGRRTRGGTGRRTAASAAATPEPAAAEETPSRAASPAETLAEGEDQARRRRRRRGGRGRGRSRRDEDEGTEAAPAATGAGEIGWEEFDDLSQLDGADEAHELVLGVARAMHHHHVLAAERADRRPVATVGKAHGVGDRHVHLGLGPSRA